MNFHGVSMNPYRRPFGIGRFIFIPLIIEKDATVGQWSFQMVTEVDDLGIEERVIGFFEVR